MRFSVFSEKIRAILQSLSEIKDEATFVHTYEGYTFVASYSTEQRCMQYDILLNNETVRALVEMEPAAFIEYGKFVEAVDGWVNGGDEPSF